jgi:hypothetical protein
VTEKAVLLRVLELARVPELELLRQQADVAVATEPCPCPCPSIGIAVDPTRGHPISHSGRLDVQVYYDTGAVMVWADDGWLSNLEVWWWSDDPPTEFPPLGTLRITAP